MTTSRRDFQVPNSNSHSKTLTSERTISTASTCSDRFAVVDLFLPEEDDDGDDEDVQSFFSPSSLSRKAVHPPSGKRSLCVTTDDFSSTDSTATFISWETLNGSTTAASGMFPSIGNATATTTNTYYSSGQVEGKSRTKYNDSSRTRVLFGKGAPSTNSNSPILLPLPESVNSEDNNNTRVIPSSLIHCIPANWKTKKRGSTSPSTTTTRLKLNGCLNSIPTISSVATIRRMMEAAVFDIQVEVNRAQQGASALARRRKLSRTLRTLRAVALWNEEFHQRHVTLRQQQQQQQQQGHLQSSSSSPYSLRHHYKNNNNNSGICRYRYHHHFNTKFTTTTCLSLRELVGDYGVALFDPLSEEAIRSLMANFQGSSNEIDEDLDQEIAMSSVSRRDSREITTAQPMQEGRDDVEGNTNDNGSSKVNNKNFDSKVDDDAISTDGIDNDYIFKHEIYPVQIEPEDEVTLDYAPRLLSESMFHELVNDAIPRNLRMYKWKRIFTIARDGDAFITMIEKCSMYKHTLVVIKTTKGHTIGGFASEPWKNQDGFDKRHSYFGTGVCFLFTDHIPDNDNANKNKQVMTYKWSGMNDYCQICDVDRRKIAMGGGEGDFGLIVEDSFLRGSSGHCATFNNPPLIPGIDGTFDILGFEVYGLLPLIPTVTNARSISHASRYSTRSLLYKL